MAVMIAKAFLALGCLFVSFEILAIDFSFAYDGVFHRGVEGLKTLESESSDQEYRLDDNVVIRIETSGEDEFGSSEYVIWFENRGMKPSGVFKDIACLDASIHGDHPVVRGIHGDTRCHYRPYCSDLDGNVVTLSVENGRATHGRFPYFDLLHGDGGTFIALGWGGNWFVRFSGDESGAHVYMRSTLYMNAVLLPGEKIRTARVVMLPYKGRDADQAMNLWRRWYLKYVLPKNLDGSSIRPFVAMNLANDTGLPNMDGSISERSTTWRNTYDSLKEAGVFPDFRWLDAGWYCDPNGRNEIEDWHSVGSWELDSAKWPAGTLRESVDACHADGVRTLMWFEPERVTGVDGLVANFGYKAEWEASGVNNIGNPDCFDWTLSRILKVLRENDIDLFREDLNHNPTGGWHVLDLREQESLGMPREGIAECKCVDAHYRLWDAIIADQGKRGKLPYVDSCAGGGGRNDIESMRRGFPLLRSDSDGTAISRRLSFTSSLCRWLPFHGTFFIEGEQTMQPSVGAGPDAYVFRASLLPVCGLCDAYTRNPQFDLGMLKRNIDEWRRFAPYTLKDFYPLTQWRDPYDDNGWTAFAWDDPQTGKSIVLGFRQSLCPDSCCKVRLPFVAENEQYELKDEDTKEVWRVAGNELRGGLTLRLEEPHSSKLISVKRQSVPIVEPVACWDGDFRSLEQGDWSVTVGEGNELSHGRSSVVLGSSVGLTLSMSHPYRMMTVIVKYSGMVFPSDGVGVLATSFSSNSQCPSFGRPGVAVDQQGGLHPIWNDGVWSSTDGMECSYGVGSGMYAFVYVPPCADESRRGTFVYRKENGTWKRVFALTGLSDWDDNELVACSIGGPRTAIDGAKAFTGMRIEGVAVFDSALSEGELSEFSFSTGSSEYSVSLTEDGSPYKWSELPWADGAAPHTIKDVVQMSVLGNVEVELDVPVADIGSLSVAGDGSLAFTGMGRLRAQGGNGRAALQTDVQLVLSNNGDVIFPRDLLFDSCMTIEKGAIGVSGRETIAGDITGEGRIGLQTGSFCFSGTLLQTGGVEISADAVATTEKGSFGPGPVVGSGTACFRKVLPDAATAENFRNAETWTGTCRLELLDAGIAAIDANKWGTESSKVCFAGVPTSYILVDNVNLPEVVLEDVVENGVVVPALVVSGGWNAWPTSFRKLSGGGTFKEDAENLTQYWYHVEDGNDFHGSIDVCNMSMSFGFRDFPPYVDNGWRCGRITVSTNAAMEIACGSTWSCPNPDVGVRVDGSLRCCTGEAFSSKVDVREGGVLEMYMTRAQNEDSGKPAEQWENVKEDARSYWWLTGLGVIRLTDDGTDYYRTMPAGMWASTLRLENCQGRSDLAGLLLRADGSATAENPTVTSVSTLSGSGNFMADGWPAVDDSRILEVTQAGPSCWSGCICGVYDRIAALRVNGAGIADSRTLTITGTNTVHVNRLEVGTTGSVRLDDAWRGDIVVAGEFGGAGTQTEGAFAFSDGAVLNGSWGMFKAASVAAWPSALEVRMESVPAADCTELVACANDLPDGLDAMSVSFGGALNPSEFKLRVMGKTLCLVRQSGLSITIR